MGCGQQYVFISCSTSLRRVLICLRVVLPVFDFYTNLNLFYGIIAEFCTSQNCPTMSAGHTCVQIWCPVHACSYSNMNVVWTTRGLIKTENKSSWQHQHTLTMSWRGCKTCLMTRMSSQRKPVRKRTCPAFHITRNCCRAWLPAELPFHSEAHLSTTVTSICAYLPRSLHTDSSSTFWASL